jgi:hypothetical protein
MIFDIRKVGNQEGVMVKNLWKEDIDTNTFCASVFYDLEELSKAMPWPRPLTIFFHYKSVR